MSCTFCWSTLFILALLEWKLAIVRGVLFFLQRTFERYTSPKIDVPLPNLAPSGAASAEPLRPQIPGDTSKIQCYDKGLNAPLGQVDVVDKTRLQTIVTKARAAQKAWEKTTFATRRKLLFSLMEYVIEHHKFLCQTSSVECGKTLVDGTLGEILTTLEKLEWTATHGERVLSEESRAVGLISIHKKAVVRYVPFGVIGAIVSWNYPFHNIYGPMISALFAGNAFVGKVSEFSSFYTKYYESIVRQGLEKLGQSPDLVSFVTGFAETGSSLIELVDKVTFIGSPGVGKLVMKKASDTLTPVVLELGGKDPAVVCDDADLDQVFHIIMRGTFQNCGQNCVGLERVVVHEAIHDKLVARLVKAVGELSQGPASKWDTKDLGAMTMGSVAVAKIQKLVDDTVAAGAKLAVGGKSTPGSQFFPATILTGVTPKMPIAVDEVFGPILVVMKFRTDDEAVDMVNDCPYGLGSSVFSGSIPRGKAIGQRLRTGMMNVNDFGINYLCQGLPFGGCKVSGFDRFAGEEGLRGNCILRAETYDRIPGVKTVIPPPLQYPLAENAFHFTELMVRAVYGRLTTVIGAAIGFASFKSIPQKKK